MYRNYINVIAIFYRIVSGNFEYFAVNRVSMGSDSIDSAHHDFTNLF